MNLDCFLNQLIEYAIKHQLINQNDVKHAHKNLCNIFLGCDFDYAKSELELDFSTILALCLVPII